MEIPDYINTKLHNKLLATGWEEVSQINPPLHGSENGYRYIGGRHTILSLHDGYLLYHYMGGNIVIDTEERLEKLNTILELFKDIEK